MDSAIQNLGVADGRFWSKVDKSKDCWIWLGARNKKGYGHLRRKEKDFHAHKYSWILFNGDVPKGICVCHRCDNRACVNPDHLFLGTILDNNRDMWRKGRGVSNLSLLSGEEATFVKLDNKSVLKIRKLYNDGLTQKEIAKIFGVVQSTISYVIRRARWGHIA